MVFLRFYVVTRRLLSVCDRPNHLTDGPALILPPVLPRPPFRPRVATPPPPPPPSRKRTAPDDDIAEVEPLAKKARTNGASTSTSALEVGSPSKRKRLEEDGLVMLESATDRMDDEDVIEID